MSSPAFIVGAVGAQVVVGVLSAVCGNGERVSTAAGSLFILWLAIEALNIKGWL